MLRHQYGITIEPKDVDYEVLIQTVGQWCSTGLFVVRPTLGLSSQGIELIELLTPHLMDQRTTASWPGTVLLDEQAKVISFRLAPEVVAHLLSATTHLYGWQQPLLPEDLCLLRDGGELALVSISHEGDAYLVLDDSELAALKHDVPGVSLALEGPAR